MALWIAVVVVGVLVGMTVFNRRSVRRKTRELERGGWLDSHSRGGFYGKVGPLQSRLR